MFAPRLRTLARPVSKAPRCLQQKRIEAIPDTLIPYQTREHSRSSQAISTRRPKINELVLSTRWQMLQRRHQSQQNHGRTVTEAFKLLYQRQPFSMAAWTVVMIFCVGFMWYGVSFYRNYIIGTFHNFPDPVAKELRRALYYMNWADPIDPKNSVKYFNRTLRVAEEMGMDPFSDEIIGVKIKLAELMEKIRLYQKAIDVLEIVKKDNLKWVEVLGDKPGNEGKRTRVLGKTVGVSVKLGELYACQYVNDKEAAEARLVWAVETALKEQKRREDEGVKEGEGEWMTPEEIGGSLEALGNRYEENNQHFLAAPLFLRALSLSPAKSCHTAVLMNNLSISMAQQLPPDGEPAISRTALVANARMWAEKAIAVAAKITPPERTEECDVGCAVATHNLGEFAEMDGNIAEARKRFEEAKSIAKAVGFQEGVINSEDALRRIGKSSV